MAFYIKDKRQANYEQNVKKAQEMLEEREEGMPTFAGVKTAVAIIGFLMGIAMMVLGWRLGMVQEIQGEIGPGSIAFVSGIISIGGGLITLISRNYYNVVPLIIATILFFMALLLLVLHPDGSKFMRGIALVNALCGLLTGFYAKTSFDLIKKKGLNYKKKG